jgi:hypothetical protein
LLGIVVRGWLRIVVRGRGWLGIVKGWGWEGWRELERFIFALSHF